jgi:hypothetical protein
MQFCNLNERKANDFFSLTFNLIVCKCFFQNFTLKPIVFVDVFSKFSTFVNIWFFLSFWSMKKIGIVC